MKSWKRWKERQKYKSGTRIIYEPVDLKLGMEPKERKY